MLQGNSQLKCSLVYNIAMMFTLKLTYQAHFTNDSGALAWIPGELIGCAVVSDWLSLRVVLGQPPRLSNLEVDGCRRFHPGAFSTYTSTVLLLTFLHHNLTTTTPFCPQQWKTRMKIKKRNKCMVDFSLQT